jgi:outer membrane protein OmpA-like peptidoglycan-associated protein/tetratricopeptide (TPR) repeat protein
MFIVVGQGYSQKVKLASADKNYESFAFVDAITTYETVALNGYKDEMMFQKLGNACYFNANLEKAAKWYAELFKMNKNQESEYYYRYAQALKSIGDYKKADKMLEQFNSKSGNELRAKLFENHKNYLEEIKSNSGRYTIVNAGINSQYSDYGSSLLGNKLIFASARDTGNVSKRLFSWTNQSFTNLYRSDLKADGTLTDPKYFGNGINSKFHESTPVFTKDGKTMYFTRNNYLDGKTGKDNQKVILLKLYKATLEGGLWNNVSELPFDSNQYSTAHPALSPDEKTLYFASDMPGSLGQSDIYKVSITDIGYGVPENLGPEINTEGRESFPFISEENELYFASDGRPGLGGLDIFQVSINSNDSFKDVQNIGAPVNSSQDDFAFMIDKSRKGFFTSNRSGGQGFDDVYKFIEINKLQLERLLSGFVTDKETGLVLPNAKISLFDSKFKFITECLTDDNGQYVFDVEKGRSYYVRSEKQFYETKESNVTIEKANKTNFPIVLEKIIKPIIVGTDLAKTVNIPNIYFDLDKFSIRDDAALELEKIVAIMKQFPNMRVDVRSHTDSRSSAKHNAILSEQRAKATMNWLVKKGIERARLTSKGFGESRLINNCSDGVECTEAQHQVNRRSEFIVISIN